MAEQKDELSAGEVYDMIMAFQKSQVLFVANTLGVFDILQKSSDMTSDAVAKQLNTNNDATERLLNACSGLHLLLKSTNAQGQATYKNSGAAATYLTSSSPSSFNVCAMMNSSVFYGVFAKLIDSVKTGDIPMPMMTNEKSSSSLKMTGPTMDQNRSKIGMGPHTAQQGTNGPAHGTNGEANGIIPTSSPLVNKNGPSVGKSVPLKKTIIGSLVPIRTPLGNKNGSLVGRTVPLMKANVTKTKEHFEGMSKASTGGGTPTASTKGQPCMEPSHMEQMKAAKFKMFIKSLHQLAYTDVVPSAAAFDLSKFKTICDLGGGSGALAVQLAIRWPECRVIMYDLPHVCSLAAQLNQLNKQANMSYERGDFFQDVLPAADLYVLSHVLHDWADGTVSKLLQRIHAALRPGGALMILEKVLTPTKDGPERALLFDIGMMLCSDGRERNLDEYRELTRAQGFTNLQFKTLKDCCFRDAILVSK